MGTLIDIPDNLHPAVLRGVYYDGEPYEAPNDRHEMVWSIRFVFDRFSLSVGVDEDTDQLFHQVDVPLATEPPDGFKAFDLLRSLTGKTLGWTWTARNSQGYFDMVILSFDGIEPHLALVGEASCIKVFEMSLVE